MYFHDRETAGRLLANDLASKYAPDSVAILAVSPGGVVVASEIARRFGARINLLLTEPIAMPGVSKSEVVGVIDHEGHFTYNDLMPTGQLMDMVAEMHSYIESEKMQKLHSLTQATNGEEAIDPRGFYGHNVVVVSDGYKSGLPFEAALNYLKPIKTGKVIAAAPISSVKAIDHLHISADGIHILDVLSNYLDTDHYYDVNDLPDIKTIMARTSLESSG